MQNQQIAAQMAAMNASNGSLDGTPIMGNMANPNKRGVILDPREQLNTYIYDYFIRNDHYDLARAMANSENLKMNTVPKSSPNNRPNGMGSMGEYDDLPTPQLPPNQAADNSFLLDWWVQFWDIWGALRGRATKGTQYIQHTRNLSQMQNEQRNQRMMMTNPMTAQYQPRIMGAIPNGVAPNDLKRTAAMNNRPNGNPMAGMPMKGQAMMPAHMQRDPSNMDMNGGQRPQSPGSNENAPSPNKRPRVDGGMNPGNVQGSQFGEFAQQGQNAQQKNIEGMSSGAPGSSMAPTGLGDEDIFVGNTPRPGMPTNPPGAPQQGNHALQDYQMQLMLLEQQNKKRLLMARQEQDNMSGPHQQGGVGAPAFATAMSPQGNRAVPSPNPADPRNRGTPKVGQQGPGSPMPDGGMQQQRNSPAPGMQFDPNLAPPGMPPQFYQQMPQNPMMRPPSSHPGPNFNNQQLAQQQQMEAMRPGQMQNGWRGPPQQGMMPGQQQMGGPMNQNPQQRPMPPPPAPSEQPRPEPSPSVSNQAPPTPVQGNKANPKKKNTKDVKKPGNKKGPNAGATPAASNGEEPPTPTASTPAAPITPVHGKSFGQGQNGGQQPVQPPQQAQQQMDPIQPPFGNIDGDPGFDLGLTFGDDTGALENFDFDSFLHTGNDGDAFGSLEGGFSFDAATEVGTDI